MLAGHRDHVPMLVNVAGGLLMFSLVLASTSMFKYVGCEDIKPRCNGRLQLKMEGWCAGYGA